MYGLFSGYEFWAIPSSYFDHGQFQVETLTLELLKLYVTHRFHLVSIPFNFVFKNFHARISYWADISYEHFQEVTLILTLLSLVQDTSSPLNEHACQLISKFYRSQSLNKYNFSRWYRWFQEFCYGYGKWTMVMLWLNYICLQTSESISLNMIFWPVTYSSLT